MAWWFARSPWARHKSCFRRSFEDRVAWLAVSCSQSAVAQLVRIAWRSVGGICARVAAAAEREVDLLAGLRRIGVEELSDRKGQRYLTVVVCQDRGSARLGGRRPRPSEGRGVPRRARRRALQTGRTAVL
jgi:transposase